MTPWSVILLGLALSMDTFAIAIASGVAIERLRLHHALKIAFVFGLSQAAMPVIGGLAGMSLRQFIALWDHWLAFAILTALGVKMIYESFKIKEVEEERDPLNSSVLIVLAVATSLDALAVGVTLGISHQAILLPAAGIGLVTFVVALTGVYLGRHSRHLNERAMECLAGVVLIGIGVKMLLTHFQGLP